MNERKANLIVFSEFSSDSSPSTKVLRSYLSDRSRNISLVKFVTFANQYHPGGLKMRRVVNLLFAPFLVLWTVGKFALMSSRAERRSTVLLSLTSPPLLQWWVILSAKLLGMQSIVWMMDYHPLIERALFKRKFFYPVIVFLNGLDRWISQKASGWIAVDRATTSILKARLKSDKPIEICPPFATASGQTSEERSRTATDKVKMIYAGNYGFAHDLRPFFNALSQLEGTLQNKFILTFVGMPSDQLIQIQKESENVWCEKNFLPRMEKLDDVRALIKSHDYGIVSLSEEMFGLVSPSKVFSYIGQGLQFVFVGPRGTSNDDWIAEGWGYHVDEFISLVKGPKKSSSIHQSVDFEKLIKQSNRKIDALIFKCLLKV